MSSPALRRRYPFPACDLIAPNLSLSLAIDNVVAFMRRIRRPLDVDSIRQANGLALLGFPRSGNTFLLTWLRSVTKSGVMVHDGRVTHSVLDLHRLATAGVTVVLPVREPELACASMMVRTNSFDDESAGRGILDAYHAWHVIAKRYVTLPNVVVLPFEEFTDNPVDAVQETAVAPLLDERSMSEYEDEEFMARLRTELADVPGQGMDEGDIPARYMISVPHEGREREQRIARGVLNDPRLSRHLRRAEAAYADFCNAAGVPADAHTASRT